MLVLATSIGVYGSQLAPHDLGMHQSDLFIYLSSKFGLLPSPGYPIYSTILYLTTNMFGQFLGMAFTAHLTSAFLVSLSVACIYLVGVSLYDYAKYPNRQPIFSATIERALLALFLATVFGASKLVWRYSLLAERYPLSLLLFSIIVLLSIKILSHK